MFPDVTAEPSKEESSTRSKTISCDEWSLGHNAYISDNLCSLSTPGRTGAFPKNKKTQIGLLGSSTILCTCNCQSKVQKVCTQVSCPHPGMLHNLYPMYSPFCIKLPLARSSGIGGVCLVPFRTVWGGKGKLFSW